MNEKESIMERFLEAWTAQDVERVLAFYTDDVVYLDPNTHGVVNGADKLRRYLPKLFAAWTMTWAVREVRPLTGEDGCALLWRATFALADDDRVLEADGMDLVLFREGKIARNEVYFDRSPLLELMRERHA